MHIHEMLMEEEIEKNAAMKSRPTKASLKRGVRPKAVVVVNQNDSYSKPFIKRLDKVLQQASGLERLEFVALDVMKDRMVVNQIGALAPSITLMKQGKTIAKLSGKNVMETEILKFFNAHRGKLV